jgi:hypothetical protein
VVCPLPSSARPLLRLWHSLRDPSAGAAAFATQPGELLKAPLLPMGLSVPPRWPAPPATAAALPAGGLAPRASFAA